MGEVYANAPSIRVWLGEDKGSTLEAFNLARSLADLGPKIEKGSLVTPEEIEERKAELRGGQGSNWRALDQIYWSPWFSRTWIIQEISSAQTATVQCGSTQMPWDELVAAAKFLVEHHLTAAVDIDPSPVIGMQFYRQAMVHRQKLSLLELMHASRGSHCMDPRDKIYGLLGIASDIEAYGINPDYNAPVEEVYQNLALAFIRTQKNLDVLSAVEDYKWRVHRKLPSWVPDWMAHPRSTPFLSQPHRWHFCASGDSHPEVSAPSADTNATVLQVRGKILDIIGRVGSADIPVRDGISGVRDTSYFRETLTVGAVAQRQHWEKLVNSLESYPTGEETPMEAWHFTVIAEGSLGSGYSTKDLPELYESWKRHWRYLLNYRLVHLPGPISAEELEDRERAMVYTQAWKEAFRFRRLLITKRGYIGLASYSIRPDDVVCLLYGGKTVYILRPIKNGHYRFISECYVRGLMQGQGMAADFGEEVDFKIS